MWTDRQTFTKLIFSFLDFANALENGTWKRSGPCLKIYIRKGVWNVQDERNVINFLKRGLGEALLDGRHNETCNKRCIRWKSSRLDFMGTRRHPPHWLSSKGSNYQRGLLLISAGATEGHFEGHQGGFVLARQCPGSPDTWIPEETGITGLPLSWSPTLFSGSGPSDCHLFPVIKKKLKFRHFSSDEKVITAAGTWLDGQTSDFFLLACKCWSNGLRSLLSFVGVYWIDREFGRCIFFPSWSG